MNGRSHRRTNVIPPQNSVKYATSTKSTIEELAEEFELQNVPATSYLLAFVIDTLPRQIYLHFLLRLPYLYFSRVTRLFEEAELTMPQIKQGILEAATQMKDPHTAIRIEPPSVPYGNLEKTWSSFIDSLMREWKTLNIISVLLLSCVR